MKILMLDDTEHVKHYKSVQDLITRGYTVTKSKDGRTAFVNLREK